MEQKYEIELKVLALISLMNLNDLQTHIILFTTLISVFKERSMYSVENIAVIGFGLDQSGNTRTLLL
jgi:hypothetical protein